MMSKISYIYKIVILFSVVFFLLIATWMMYQKEHDKNIAQYQKQLLIFSNSIEKKEELISNISLLKHEQSVVTVVLITLFGLWLFLFIGSYLGLLRSIDGITSVLKRVSMGGLHFRVTSQSDDEFKVITHALNDTLHTLEHEHSLLSEYRRAVDESALVAKTDVDGIITYVNPAYEEISGFKKEELIGRTHALVRSKVTTDIELEEMWQTILDKKIYRNTFENMTKYQRPFYVESTIVPIIDEHGEISEFISIMYDISELKAKELALQERLVRDDLTGMPNRNALNMRIEAASECKLLLLNIDNFSSVNSLYGESIADELLKQLAHYIRRLTKSGDLELFKLAADEFAIFADNKTSEAFFKEDVVMLSHYLNPVKLQCFAYEVTVRVSCGAVIRENHEVSRPLIAMAHIALNEARKRPKSYYFYNTKIDNSLQIERNILTLERLDYAIKNNTIIGYFQPIYNVKEGRIEKFETLMRLVDSAKNVYAPDEFLHVAKNARMYARLTHQILMATIQKAEENPGYYFSVNIGLEDILDSRTHAFILQQLRESTCAERILFELVESAEIEQTQEVKNFVENIRSYGCSIAIDDFGSGYSNYAYLVDINVDIVKIDGSLIKDIDVDENKRKITASVINIAHELGIECVAEYVSTESIFNVVCELGVDYVQGYYVAPASRELHTMDFLEVNE